MINIKDIASGSLDGKIVWICDLRYNDYRKKPIRHIKPTRVLIRSNKETDKIFYYSNSHFVELKVNGQPKSKMHSLFDNTGYREFKGVEVNCFYTEKECKLFYKFMCNAVLHGYEEFKTQFFKDMDNKMEEYKNYKIVLINYNND